MQKRTQFAIVQVCLAMACALGAGFSGDMRARTTGHGGHHSRGNTHRSTRYGSRHTLGDQWHELDTLQATVFSSASDADAAQVATIPVLSLAPPGLVPVGLAASSPLDGFVTLASSLRLPSRAPPSLS